MSRKSRLNKSLSVRDFAIDSMSLADLIRYRNSLMSDPGITPSPVLMKVIQDEIFARGDEPCEMKLSIGGESATVKVGGQR